MLRICMMMASCVLLPLAVSAQDKPQVKINEKDCRLLVEHHADAGVAYQPGVDVHGKAVAPADLNSNRQVQVPDQVYVDILIPLTVFRPGRRLGVASGLDVDAGSVTVDLKTGKASYNGQPLNQSESDELYTFCRGRKN